MAIILGNNAQRHVLNIQNIYQRLCKKDVCKI